MSNPVQIKRLAAVPSIQQPGFDLQSHSGALVKLKEGVETLSGQRGPVSGRAVTFDDLVALGLIDIKNGLATRLP